jgi:hypothetical protein
VISGVVAQTPGTVPTVLVTAMPGAASAAAAATVAAAAVRQAARDLIGLLLRPARRTHWPARRRYFVGL